MYFLIKFAQAHETFRIPEIRALAILENVDLEVVEYKEEVYRTQHPVWTEGEVNKNTVPAMHSQTHVTGGSKKTDPEINNCTINSRALGLRCNTGRPQSLRDGNKRRSMARL
jgi:tRNA (guanine10-N2)-methyltransferase